MSEGEEQIDLEITIENDFWTNFSSNKFKRNAPNRATQASQPNKPQASENESSKPENKHKFPEEILQSDENLTEKLSRLLEGQFAIHKDMNPRYHLIMDFQENDLAPMILVMPDFTAEQVKMHFEAARVKKNLEKINKEQQNQLMKEKEKEVVNRKRYQAFKDMEKLQEINVEKIDADITKSPEGEVVAQVQSTPTVETKVEEISSKVRSELKDVPTELPKQEPNPFADGHLLGSRLFTDITLNSFHYVNLSSLSDKPNLLLRKWIVPQKFKTELLIGKVLAGPNFMLKDYLTSTILQYQFLVQRYFRNPVLYTDGNEAVRKITI